MPKARSATTRSELDAGVDRDLAALGSYSYVSFGPMVKIELEFSNIETPAVVSGRGVVVMVWAVLR